MQKYFFILGAKDPEMEGMEKLLKENGHQYAVATISGVRVNAGNTYSADAVLVPDGYTPVVIETEPSNFEDWSEKVRIDHHRPGDFGYDLGYDRYFEASSLGQLCKLLNIAPSQEHLVLTAMDHCFTDALMGKCEGVSKDEVLKLKILNIASATGKPFGEVDDAIKGWLSKIDEVGEVKSVDGVDVVNFTEIDLGVGYSFELLTAQVASVLSGKAVLLKHKDSEGSELKVTINGNNSAGTIRYFKEEFSKVNNFNKVYGVETRKYAGGYYSSNTTEPLKLELPPNEPKIPIR